MYNLERNYVDDCVQTDICGHHLDEVSNIGIGAPILRQEPQYQIVQTMSFGLMQDYFRGQYSLGDALYYGLSMENEHSKRCTGAIALPTIYDLRKVCSIHHILLAIALKASSKMSSPYFMVVERPSPDKPNALSYTGHIVPTSGSAPV